MAERRPEWQALGFSSPEAYEDAKAASEEMLKIEYLMGVQDKLPEGYKMNQGPGKVLTALGLYGDQTDNPQFSQPANIRSYTHPIGSTGSRTLGRYVIPYQNYAGAMSLPEYEEILSREFSGIKAAMLGGPTQEDDVFVDQTLQYNKVEGRPYENTLKHELRHRGVASERVQDYLSQKKEEGAPWWKDRWEHRKDVANLNRVGTTQGEHEIYELLRQLQTGERTRENLLSREEDMLRGLENLEAGLLEGMSEEERMRLGFLPEEPGFLDKLMSIMD
jgi:hypothetical protein